MSIWMIAYCFSRIRRFFASRKINDRAARYLFNTYGEPTQGTARALDTDTLACIKLLGLLSRERHIRVIKH